MRNITAFVLTLALLVSACDQQEPAISQAVGDAPEITLSAGAAVAAAKGGTSNAKMGSVADDDRVAAAKAYMEKANADLASRGLSIAIEKVEWVGGGEGHEAGQTVFANDRTLRLGSQWVPDDERRDADGLNLTQVVDQTFAFANSFNPFPAVNGEPAIDAAFDTWDAVNCSKVDIVKRPDVGINYSALVNTGDPIVDIFYADISTVGFVPGFLFDIFLGPGASNNVLGVTFTFVWLEFPGGPRTDINNDGYDDTALAEVWYNDAFLWSTDGGPGVDIETVALHENGHALGLGHFGRVARTESNGKLHVSPRAVMNAFILGTLRDPLGTDNGAYCGLYGAWPN